SFSRDWSSDVCSADLPFPHLGGEGWDGGTRRRGGRHQRHPLAPTPTLPRARGRESWPRGCGRSQATTSAGTRTQPSLRTRPFPRLRGKVGMGGRAAGAEGARATRLPPPQPPPPHGGGGHGRTPPLPPLRGEGGRGGRAAGADGARATRAAPPPPPPAPRGGGAPARTRTGAAGV